ncbi:MAG: SpoIIE family protein phosphatase [Planctomycetaceae bacterium]
MMSREPVAVGPNASISEVLQLMRRRNIGAVVVVSEAGVPIGIFTERDLLHCAECGTPAMAARPIGEIMTPDPWTLGADTDWQTALDMLQRRQIRHAPVVEQGRLVGMLSIRDIMKHRNALLESLISERTSELQRQKLIVEQRDRERTQSLRIAGRIQRQLLPEVAPACDPLDVAFAFHPHDEVAGDYFDLLSVDPDMLIVIIGDASGHGVPAAFISVIVKTCVHTRLSETKSPAALLGAINEFLYGWVEPEHFISMFVAAINRRTLQMTLARAGHPRPLLLKSDGNVVPLEADGIMIGVLPDPEFPEQSVQLHDGDRVLFFTDGLTECPDASQDLFGIDRVRQFLVEHRELDCGRLVSSLVEQVRGYSAAGAFADDLTIVCVDVGRLPDSP